MSFLSRVVAIVWKDIITEMRSKEILISMFTFSFLVMVVFNFAFELKVEDMAALSPGVLWVAFIFAGLLGLSRSFVIEKDRGSLEGLMLAPADRSAIYLGKLASNLIFMLLVEGVMLPIFAALYNAPVLSLPVLLVVFLGTLGFASVGTLFSAVAVNTRIRETMMPVLFLPIVVPVIIASVKFTGSSIGGSTSDALPWVNLLIAFDAIFLAISFLAFEFVVEE
ncbi:MAG: heme exporter protein CcmB [Candidatus Marsarchaeota archaeon]|nr:heme exporter protein CcmB [Candidatus Marsarchaeota archaeon]